MGPRTDSLTSMPYPGFELGTSGVAEVKFGVITTTPLGRPPNLDDRYNEKKKLFTSAIIVSKQFRQPISYTLT